MPGSSLCVLRHGSVARSSMVISKKDCETPATHSPFDRYGSAACRIIS